MTNDGLDDVVSLVSGGNVAVTPQLAVGGFGAATVYPGATNPWGFFGIGVGDVNGDGRTDVFSTYGGNKPNSFVALLVQNASGGLAAPVSYPSYDIPEPIDGADFDLDGLADVGVAHSWWNAFGVYLGRGDGTLAPEALYTLPFGNDYRQQGIDVGDVNGDGAPDVVLANDSSGLVVLRNKTQVRAPARHADVEGRRRRDRQRGAHVEGVTGGERLQDLSRHVRAARSSFWQPSQPPRRSWTRARRSA